MKGRGEIVECEGRPPDRTGRDFGIEYIATDCTNLFYLFMVAWLVARAGSRDGGPAGTKTK